MNSRLYSKVIIFLSVLFYSFLSYAENSNLAADMIDNLNVDNTYNITIPSANGNLIIFIEKSDITSQTADKVVFYYNDNEIAIQSRTNFAVTQDGELVFSKKENNIYAHAHKIDKDNLSIKYNKQCYTYEKDKLRISSDETSLHASEVIFHKDSRQLDVYNNGYLVKTVNFE